MQFHLCGRVKSIDSETRMVIVKGERGIKVRGFPIAIEFKFCKMETILGMDSGDGYRTT